LDVYFLGMPETRKRLPLNAYMKTKIVIILALFLCFLATFPVRPAFAQPNQPPVATDDAYSTDEETLLSVAAPGVLGNDTDADSDPLTAHPKS
jgi:hypothetical protein